MEDKDFVPYSRLYEPSKLSLVLGFLQCAFVYKFYVHISGAALFIKIQAFLSAYSVTGTLSCNLISQSWLSQEH